MKNRRRLFPRLVAFSLVFSAVVGCKGGHDAAAGTGHTTPSEVAKVVHEHARDRLVAFSSRAEFDKFLKDLDDAREVERKRQEREARRHRAEMGAAGDMAPAASPAPAAATGASNSATAKAGESITNNQQAGVDEGGIVKVHGNHLVVLRRGRLFSVNIGDGALSPVSAADCYGPGIDPSGTWYDEMLVSGNTIAVIGYSYQRGGTEVGLFDIDDAGRIRYRATYHLRSNDYYSSRNYASRLIGDKLIFYSPFYVGGIKGTSWLPAVRRWRPNAAAKDFVSILEPTHVYRPIDVPGANEMLALHTVTTCDLAKGDFACTARAVMGPAGRVFYVSQDSVFVWMTPWGEPGPKHARSRSLLYRLPLTGEEPSVLRVGGGPIDQFSFLQGDDKQLNVLVRSDTAGDAMWAPESTGGEMALLRVPLSSFNRAAEEAPGTAYTRLPKIDDYAVQNRFVGDYLLYGAGSGWGYGAAKPQGKVVAYRYADAGKSPARDVVLGHGADRIEPMGKDAVVVGGDGKDLFFSAIALDGAPSLAGRYVRTDAAQGEARSHGFFYKPDGAQQGIFGLPIRGGDRPGYAHLTEGSASILFVKNDHLAFQEVGELASSVASPSHGDDGCKASCVDWYGNARPIFLRGRVFALLGYELVEGKKDADGRIREVRRASFAPAMPAAR